MPTREVIIDAGVYRRVHAFPVRRNATGKRGTRCKPTLEVQQKLNDRHAAYKLSDILHLNFSETDISIRLSYDIEPISVPEAKRNIQNYIRRVKRYCALAVLDTPKYVYTTERGSRNGRYHHHLVISGIIDRDTLEKLWGRGYCNTQRLRFTDDGLQGLAHYIGKWLCTRENAEDDESEKCGYRCFSCSKGLKRPKPKKNDYRLRKSDVAALANEDRDAVEALYPGYRLVKVEACEIDSKEEIKKSPFITIFLIKDGEKRKKSEERIEKSE